MVDDLDIGLEGLQIFPVLARQRLKYNGFPLVAGIQEWHTRGTGIDGARSRRYQDNLDLAGSKAIKGRPRFKAI